MESGMALSTEPGEAGARPYRFGELAPEEAEAVVPLYHRLIRHLEQSPCFLSCQAAYDKSPADRVRRGETRVWAAWDTDRPMGYLEYRADGENFLCESADMMNISGAYLLEPYRGQGVFDRLLGHGMNAFYQEGYRRLGVDFESFNPTAYGFWRKHFVPYTHGLVRRIDGGECR